VTNNERERIREAARRYVREQAPNPPIEVLERVARIVLETRGVNDPLTEPVAMAANRKQRSPSALGPK
jgi:hypothetical protein